MNPDASTSIATARRSRTDTPIGFACWLLAGTVTTALLFWFDPAFGGFYPVCPLYRLTGWQCPGCGGLRAIHQLLHGHWLEAARLNALLVVSLPFLAWFGARQFARKIWGREFRHGAVHPALLWAGLGAVLAFSVARNLVF